ncbi:MAG: O-methyltransferase [Clostridiales bacterium]|nr:O-methyltransferase [Clostridiales bacterium]
MIDENRAAAYIRSLDRGHGELCDRIAREARAAWVPVIRAETASFLQTMIVLRAPLRILEVGTAVGYSAILMAQVMPADAHITTMEMDPERIEAARKNFRMAGVEERVTLLSGDASLLLNKMSGAFDFIFLDAAKGQYIHWLPRLLGLLEPGGVLFSDNVLMDGDILESRFAVERRNRTIHANMREYLYALTHTDALRTSVLPLGDGVALSVRTAKDTGEKS